MAARFHQDWAKPPFETACEEVLAAGALGLCAAKSAYDQENLSSQVAQAPARIELATPGLRDQCSYH